MAAVAMWTSEPSVAMVTANWGPLLKEKRGITWTEPVGEVSLTPGQHSELASAPRGSRSGVLSGQIHTPANRDISPTRVI